MKTHSDNQILKACLRGDRKAQYRLYQKHEVEMFGISMRYAKSKAEAEDILQEGFYRIFKDLHQYKGKVPLKSWMRKVIVNTALMHIRKYRKLQYTELTTEARSKAVLVDRSYLAMDRANAIIQLIRKLPIQQQTVFNLKAMDGYSYKEIAQLLQVKETTLRSHFLRARSILQELLKKELNKDG